MIVFGDIHFGAYEKTPQFSQYQIGELYKGVEYARENGINQITFLGDIFDERFYIYSETLHIIDEFFDSISDLEVFVIAGNHDIMKKHNSIITPLRSIFRGFKNVTPIIDGPYETKSRDGSEILMIPWINRSNNDSLIDAMKKSSSEICLGHFEINGFVMNGTHECDHGLPRSIFEGFDSVISGHFHLRQKFRGIHYAGSLCQLDRGDIGKEKGFHVIDNGISFIPSATMPFAKIVVDDGSDLCDCRHIENSFVDIIINRPLSAKEEKTLARLTTENIRYTIVDNTVILNDESGDGGDVSEDFETMLSEYLETQDIGADIKNDVSKKLIDTYLGCRL